jgi:CubicO group peptidase (beta-lactamase class C family)
MYRITLLLLFLSLTAMDRYPGKHWLMYKSPEEAGFSSAGLARAKQYWETLDSAAVLVIHDGAVLIAWGDVERRFIVHSVRKSLMSGLYGIHVDAGNIDLDTTLAQLKIDDENPSLNDEEKAATIRDLIRARSGVYHAAAAEPPQNRKPARGSHRPGEHWCYNGWDFNALGTILEQEAKVKIFEEFKRCFADPLGMEDYSVGHGCYQREPEKSIHPCYHFRMSARDMARFGLLYLRRGRWKNKRILSQAWIEESTRMHSMDDWGWHDGYGYLWWICLGNERFKRLGMYSARGVGEQTIDVAPGAKMVFVHRTDTYDGKQVRYDEWWKLMEMILDAKESEPALHPKLVPLPRVKRDQEPFRLSTVQKKALCGDYAIPRWRMDGRIYLQDRELFLKFPMGEFMLIPQGPNLFMLEDMHELYYLENGRLLSDGDLVMEGYALLEKGKMDEAIEAFKKAVRCFPLSANAHDSLGEGYMKAGRIPEAVASYERSLELDPDNENGKEMLEKLRK